MLGLELALYAGVLAAAAVLSRTGSAPALVAARGAMWAVLGLALFAMWDSQTQVPLGATWVFDAASTRPVVAALVALPLVTALVRTRGGAQLPVARFPRAFLAGATASAGTGIALLLIALPHLSFATPLVWWLSLSGAALLASGVGVARMRTWGVLLAAAASIGALFACALLARGADESLMLIPALPGTWAFVPRAVRPLLAAVPALPGLALALTLTAARAARGTSRASASSANPHRPCARPRSNGT